MSTAASMNAVVKRASRAALRRGAGDSVWGQAVLAELDEVEGTWATLRWTAGGLGVAWGQRSRTTRRLAVATVCAMAAPLPLRWKISWEGSSSRCDGP